MRLIDADTLIKSMALENAVKWGNKDGYQQDHSYSTLMRYEIKREIDCQPTVDAIPIDHLAVWLAGYHVSPPEYALKETGALNPIDPAGTVFTPNQIATAWAYHLRKLVESGLMDTGGIE
jgi:hypothetical protein